MLKISTQYYSVFIYKIKKKPDRLKIGKLVWTGPNQHMLLVLMGHKNPASGFICFILLYHPERNSCNYLWTQPALVCLQKMCNFRSAKKKKSNIIYIYIDIYISVVWACEEHESMHCCRDSDVVYWILSELSVGAQCMWCMVGAGGRFGSVVSQCRFLAWKRLVCHSHS